MFICADSWLEAGEGRDPSPRLGRGRFGIHPHPPPLAGRTVELCAASPVRHSNKCLSWEQPPCAQSRVGWISCLLIDSQAAWLAVTRVFFPASGPYFLPGFANFSSLPGAHRLPDAMLCFAQAVGGDDFIMLAAYLQQEMQQR